MYKGGIGAKYNNSCNIEELKKLDNITLNFYNFTTKKNMHDKFFTYNAFCKFMDENNFGIKLFRNNEEFNEENQKIVYLFNHLDQKFISENTCLAITNNRIYYSILNTNFIIFNNFDGAINSPGNIKKYIKVNPLLVFEKIYNTSFNFLKKLHDKEIYYTDIKCENILINLLDNTSIEIAIGDLGSIVVYDTDNDLLTNRSYTFMDPIDDQFIKYWTTGKGSKFSFIKKLNIIKPNLFSSDNIKEVYDIWQSANRIPKEDIDDDEYDYYYETLQYFANATDWFHFGIAMIQFIIYINDKELYKYIDIIFDFFCNSPMIFDKNINFNCILYHDTKIIKKKISSSI
jgi:serine/threonine protein kinase